MCHKRGLRMVWNSVMRKKWDFLAFYPNGHQMIFFQTKVFGKNGVAQNFMPKYLQEGEVCCGCSCFCRDKALLCKRENIGKYFHPAFTGFLNLFRAIMEGRKYASMFLDCLKFYLWWLILSLCSDTAIYGAFPWTRSLKQHGKQIFTQLIKHRIAENNNASNYREFTTIFAGYLGHIVAASETSFSLSFAIYRWWITNPHEGIWIIT